MKKQIPQAKRRRGQFYFPKIMNIFRSKQNKVPGYVKSYVQKKQHNLCDKCQSFGANTKLQMMCLETREIRWFYFCWKKECRL